MGKISYRRQVKLLWISFLSAVVFITLYVYAVSSNLFGLFGGMPGLDNLANPKSEIASEVFSADNVSLGKYFRENRSPVTFEEVSPNLIKALYATEDIRFDKHAGIDLKGTVAILWYMFNGDRRGSSTLSQQLAKNLFATRSEAYEGTLSGIKGIGTLIIKTKEWITAINLEKTYSKKEILEMYLNTVHFGSNAYGIKVAARTFFNTTPDKLTVEQAAVLVGVLKAPSYYSPVYNKENSLRRRNTVLNQMYRYDFLTERQNDSLKALPIRLSYRVENHNEGYATYFRTELRKDLLAFCKEYNSNNEDKIDLFSDGLKIYTTIDSRMQHYAEEAVSQHMQEIQGKFFEFWKGRSPWTDENGNEIKGFIENAARRSDVYKNYLVQFSGNADSAMARMRRPIPMSLFSWEKPQREFDTVLSPIDSIRYMKHFLHAGLLSMDPHTGYIKAWVGGINYKYFKYDHVKQGRRQPGSSFKPILYAAAIDNGYTPCFEMVDAPVSIYVAGSRSYWQPKNSDGNFTGEKMTLRTALAQSINSVAAQLIQKIGVNTVVEYAKRLGIESPLDAVPALALGSSDVSVYEMVGAYSTFVSGGILTKPYYITRIEDKNGNVLKKYTPEKKEVLNEETAYQMVHMLRGATTVKNGTALGLYRLGKTLYGNEVAAKTGTTSNYSDGWFVGCTKDLVTGIWVGGDDRAIHFRSSTMGQGARLAMPIWSYYMDKVYADPATGITKGPFPKPKNLSVELDCNAAKQAAGAPTDSAELSKTYVLPQGKQINEDDF